MNNKATDMKEDEHRNDEEQAAPCAHDRDVDYDYGPYILYRCCAVAFVGGMLFGWDTGASFGDGYDYYFGFKCPPLEDEVMIDVDVDVDIDIDIVIDIDGNIDSNIIVNEEIDVDECVLSIEEEDERKFELLAVGTHCLWNVIGAMFVAPYIFDKHGRKLTLIVSGIIYLIGSILQAASINIPMMYMTQWFSACGIGMLSMICPLYIMELAPLQRRGQFVTLFPLGFTTGMILVSIFNLWLKELYIGWRISFIGNILLSILFLFLCRNVPESHVYYMIKHQYENAQHVLQRLRSFVEGNIDEVVEFELKELQKEVDNDEAYGNKACKCGTDLLFSSSPKMGLRVFYGICIQIINQFSGIAAISIFTPILLDVGYGSRASGIGSILLNIVNLMAGVATIITIERIGRPMILFSGGLVIVVIVFCLLFVQVAIGTFGSSSQPSSGDIWYFVMFSAFFQLGFSYSWGPLSWIYCVELFDIRTRGRAVGITTAAYYIANNVIVYLSLHLENSTPQISTLSVFAGVALVSLPFVYICLPETTNKTPTEIGIAFKNHKPALLRLDWGPN